MFPAVYLQQQNWNQRPVQDAATLASVNLFVVGTVVELSNRRFVAAGGLAEEFPLDGLGYVRSRCFGFVNLFVVEVALFCIHFHLLDMVM